MRERDENCCLTRLLASSKPQRQSRDSFHTFNKVRQLSAQCRAERCHLITMKYYQHLINNMTLKLYHSTSPKVVARIAPATSSSSGSRKLQTSSILLPLVLVISLSINSLLLVASSPSQSSHHQQQHSATSKDKEAAEALLSQQLPAQARAGGLEPADYIDEAGELEVLAGQQQIPTAQLMAAAGHIVPDNFFMPGGSIPTAHYVQQQRYLQQAQQQVQQLHQQSQAEQMREAAAAAAASQLQARIVPAPARYGAARSLAPIDLLVAAATEQLHQQQQQQQQQQQLHKDQHQAHQQHSQQQQHQQASPDNQNQVASLIDFNGYNLAAQPDVRDSGAQVDLAEFLAGSAQQQQNGQSAQLAAALYEQQLAAALNEARQQQHMSADGGDRQQAASMLAEHLQALASGQHQQQLEGASSEASEHYQLAPGGANANMIGPDYQLLGASSDYSQGGHYEKEQQQHQQHQQQHGQQNQKPYGLPTKSSSKEPPGMLKPLGNPKTISSPVVDFVANNLPKTSGLEKLAEKLPQTQTPTVFSFASSKDPTDKVKAVNQKKRNVMRQAEQMARMLIKSVNEKFGTTIGDQSDIPFLLSSLGPLGFAQNVLLDPTLLVTLLNSAEKTYFSDVLPGPAKSAIRPVLNLFRVPNKKRDKANLLNIISYLTSGGQTSATVPSKHRASFGIEKSAGGSSSGTKNKDKSSR